MDRLIEAIESKQNPSVVGLDPTEALVPAQIVSDFGAEIDEGARCSAVRRLLRIQPCRHRRRGRHRAGRQAADRHV